MRQSEQPKVRVRWWLAVVGVLMGGAIAICDVPRVPPSHGISKAQPNLQAPPSITRTRAQLAPHTEMRLWRDVAAQIGEDPDPIIVTITPAPQVGNTAPSDPCRNTENCESTCEAMQDAGIIQYRDIVLQDGDSEVERVCHCCVNPGCAGGHSTEIKCTYDRPQPPVDQEPPGPDPDDPELVM